MAKEIDDSKKAKEARKREANRLAAMGHDGWIPTRFAGRIKGWGWIHTERIQYKLVRKGKSRYELYDGDKSLGIFPLAEAKERAQ